MSNYPSLFSYLRKFPLSRPRSLAKLAMPLQERASGEMAEWLKAHAWKACVRETVPWVRIPLSPPSNLDSAEVLQIQAFLEPPDFDGGAPRWSTTVEHRGYPILPSASRICDPKVE